MPQHEYDAVQNLTTNSSPFALDSAQEFDDRMLTDGVKSVEWIESNFTCNPEVIAGLEKAGSTKDSFFDIVKGEWPYIALAGGMHPCLSEACSCIIFFVSRCE